jgi:hypothetical protein
MSNLVANTQLCGLRDHTSIVSGSPLVSSDELKSRSFARYRQSDSSTAMSKLRVCAAVLLGMILRLFWLLPGKPAARLNRLYWERNAMAPEAAAPASQLDRSYNATLDRLGADNETSWWRELILNAEGDYVLPYRNSDPHPLRIASVRDWLSDCYVRTDLKALATEKILAGSTNSVAVRERLAQSYARYTSDDPHLASGPIHIALLGLIAGVNSTLDPSDRILLDLMRELALYIKNREAEMLGCLSRIEKILSLRTGQPESLCQQAQTPGPSPAVSKPIHLAPQAPARERVC